MVRIKDSIPVFILLLLTSIITILLFSVVTSPLYGEQYIDDSSVFEVIGKGWAQGFLPYRDLWDSKGPYVFFIDMLGYKLGGKVGLFILEIINIWITKWWIYKIFRFSFDKWKAFALSAICVSTIANLLWYFGNTQSEWCLPFLAASMYYIFDYVLAKEYSHKNAGAFAYGLTIGVSLMSRPINCIYIAFSACAIGALLIYHKEWKNLFQNILFGLLGIITIVIPFVIYFALNGALYDMVFASFLYNLKYANFSNFSLSNLLETLLYNSLLLIGIYVIIKAICQKQYKMILVLLTPCFISFLYMLLFTFAFPHYFLLFLPIYAVLLSIMFKDEKYSMIKTIVIGFLMLINICYSVAGFLPESWPYQYSDDFKIAISDCMNAVPKGATFLTINEPQQHEIYLKYDITPNNKYFYYQDLYALIDNEITKDILKDFEGNMPEYVLFSDISETILVDQMPTINTTIYASLLKNNYDIIMHKVVKENGDDVNFYLLQLNSNKEGELSL